MSTANEPLHVASESRGLALRRALYGGIFGSMGATAGWLLWIALQAGWSVLLAPVISVAFELIRKWYGYHKHVAAIEAGRGQSVKTEDGPSEDSRGPFQGSIRASIQRAVLFSFPVLFAILLGVAADLINKVFTTYLQTVATLFPVGAVFALWFHKDYFRPGNIMERIALGAIGGTIATIASLLVFFAIGGKEALPDLQSSWWVLVGVCFALAHVEEADNREPAILAPVAGMTILLVLIGILVNFNLDRYAIAGLHVIPATVNSVLAGPDLPATSWNTVNKKADEGGNKTGVEAVPQRWKWLRGKTGCNDLPAFNITTKRIRSGCEDPLGPGCAVPECRYLETDCPIKTLGPPANPVLDLQPGQSINAEDARRLAEGNRCKQRRVACDQALEGFKRAVEDPASDNIFKRELLAEESKNAPEIYRKRMLCKQLAFGWGSGLVRSLLAILMFGAFWGWGRSFETSYRPLNYMVSRTRRLDLIVLGAMLFLILTVIIVSRSS